MKKRFLTLALSALCCCAAVSVPLSAAAEGSEKQNAAPNVIPAVREWEGGYGVFTLQNGMKIVLEADELLPDAQRAIVQEYFSDILGFTPTFSVASACEDGDLFLRAASAYPAKERAQSLGTEGYILAVDTKATVYADRPIGFLYGIITLLQSHVADGYMPQGEAYDVPSYPIRSGMLDVGRAYIPLPYVEEITKYFAWFKLNEIHLHINDNGSDGKGYFRLESNVEGLTSEEHYTKDEYRAYQKRMLPYGVEVVTEIDTPAHSKCFASAVPSYMYDAAHLDITNPDAVQFVCDLWDEYVTGDDPVFVSKTVHFGTDEFPAGHNEEMRAYTDRLLRHLRSRGCTPRFWGSFGGDGFNGETPVSSDAQTNFWAVSLSDYRTLFDMGYDVINTCGPVLYCVPGGNYGFADYYDLKVLYSSWYVNYMGHTANAAVAADHPQLKGACFALWNDLWGDGLGFSMFDVFDRVRYQVCLISEKAWTGEQTRQITAEDFISRFDTLSLTAGGCNPGRREQFPITKENCDGIKSVGYPYMLTANVQVESYPCDLFSGDEGRLYVDESGKLCLEREAYTFAYRYQLPLNTDVKLQLYADRKQTMLIVDDTWFYAPYSLRDPQKALESSSFVLPLQQIGDAVKDFTVSEPLFDPADYRLNVNLALNKTVTVSGLEVDYGLNEPLAVDGNMGTRLSFARDKDEQWMIVDLGRIMEIEKVTIHFFETVSAYEVYISEDGTNYTKVAEREGVEEGKTEQSFTERFSLVRARYVKYVQLKRWFCAPYNTYYSGGISEFEVYGAVPARDELMQEAKDLSAEDSAIFEAYSAVTRYLSTSDTYLPHLNGLYAQLETAVEAYKASLNVPSEAESTPEISEESAGEEKPNAFPWIAAACVAVVIVGGIVAVCLKKRKKHE